MTNKKNWRNWLMALVGAEPADKQELLNHLRELQKSGGHLDTRDMEMIEGVFSMSDWQIRDVMIPKNDIVGMSVNDDYASAVRLVCAREHSRYPVFAADGEHVCGILLAKDLLRHVNAPADFHITQVMREPIFEPPSKTLNAMLDDFRRRRTHMVVVIDEYELPAGIVTIEDVLERIVGEIEDEFDDEDDQAYTQTDDGAYVIKGTLSVEEFNAKFEAHLPEDGADTVAGWLAAEIGRLPEKHYVHKGYGFVFEVLEVDRRIYTLKVSADSAGPTD